jgi:hypothetical protein
MSSSGGELIFAGSLDEAHRDRAVMRVIAGDVEHA